MSNIAEHDSENERVGQPYEYRRIKFVMGGKAVHLDEHFKRLEQLRVLQFGGRFPEVGVVVVLHNDKDLVVVLHLFYKFFNIILCHPSAENVVIFLIIFHTRRKFAHIKVVG